MIKNGRVECPACGSGSIHEGTVKQADGQGQIEAVKHEATCLDCGEKWAC